MRSPKPKRRRYESIRSSPSSWASMIVPMFDDVAMMSVGVHWVVGCGSWSVNRWSDTWRLSGTVSTEVGETTPSSRAAARVMTLFTEPGSNTVVRARLLPLGDGRAAALGDRRGWPWRGSRRCAGTAMITVPPRAPIRSIWAGEGGLGGVLQRRSIVRTRSSPARAARRRSWRLPGIVRPLGSRLDDHLAGLAGEDAVVLQLEARPARRCRR